LRIAAVVGHALVVAARNRTYIDDVATLAKQLDADGTTGRRMVLNGPEPPAYRTRKTPPADLRGGRRCLPVACA
jgi:hypothetical protein